MTKKDIGFYFVFFLIIALAFSLRFYNLEERVFHHDEDAVGFFTYKLYQDGIYSYDPSFHGPFMYYATTEMFRLFGDSEYSARFLPAFLGSAMIFLLIPLRKYIGKIGILLTAFFLAISPSFLYYSRFYREDIFIAFFSLLMLVCMVKYAEERSKERYSLLRVFYLFLGAVALASLAALKENAYIMMALIAFFVFLYFIKSRVYQGLLEKLKKRDKNTLIIAVELAFFILVLLAVFSLYYTGKPLDITGMKIAVEKAVGHWYEMHKIQRIGGPLYFYIPIMALYELPILVFGLSGIIYFYKKKNFFMTFIGYWALTNLMIYSYLQEKVPWLILNMLLPLVILAGGYLNEILPKLRFNTRSGAIVMIFLVASSSYFAYSSILLNYHNYTNTAEPLIQAAQPPQKFSLFIDKMFEISRQYSNQSTEIQLTDAEMETPFLWHFRKFSNVKWRVDVDSELNAPLVVVKDSDNKRELDIVENSIGSGYTRLDSAKMSWYWFRPSDITLDYLLFRKMDRPPDEYRVVLFYKEK